MFDTRFNFNLDRNLRLRLIENFDFLYNRFSQVLHIVNNHKTTDENAHDASQIKYNNTNVKDELDYQKGRYKGLILGHNGNGIQELRDARVALDGSVHNLLSERIKYDIEFYKNELNKKIEDIHKSYPRYINLLDIGAKNDGKTDNTLLFDTLEDKNVYYVPEGTYITKSIPNGHFYGKGIIKHFKEILKIDDKTPQRLNVDFGTKNPERYYNYVLGQEAGTKQTKESYSNTGVGYAVFRNNTRGRRLTGFGKGAISNMVDGYSNAAFGADALGQSDFGKRNVALGDNALKWGGVKDPIATLHDFWKDKGNDNFINSYFMAKWKDVWSYLGTEEKPEKSLMSYRDDDYTNNVGVGRNALLHMMKGIGNTAVGYNSQAHTLWGTENTSFGNRSLRDNLIGERNTSVGSYSQTNNITGRDNATLGGNTLQQTLHASNNTAIGYGAMHFFKDDKNKGPNVDTSHAIRNVAIGTQTMQDGKNGSYNTVAGSYAGRYIEGNHNALFGAGSLPKGDKAEKSAAVGSNTLKEVITGKDNTAVGYAAGPTGDYSGTTSIGAYAHATGNNQVQIGSKGDTVYTFKEVKQRSDRRDKENINETKFGLDFVKRLKPVDFSYKDSESGRKHHGFIAQDLEALQNYGYDFGGVDNPKYNGGDDVYSVGYSELIAPLVKATQELEESVRKLQKENYVMKKQLEALKNG